MIIKRVIRVKHQKSKNFYIVRKEFWIKQNITDILSRHTYSLDDILAYNIIKRDFKIFKYNLQNVSWIIHHNCLSEGYRCQSHNEEK